MKVWSSLRTSLNTTCALCGATGARGRDLCCDCLDDLPTNNCCCRRCALPVPTLQSNVLCGRCLQATPAYVRILCPYLYEPPCDYIVKRLKFNEAFYFARIMGELLADSVDACSITQPDCLIPIPLHPQRLRERGFNQAEAIAAVVAKRLNCPGETGVLHRVRDTPTQMALPAKQRKKNVRNAFAVKGSIAGARVALIDDVVTTTATVNEVARTLCRAGVAEVQVWAFARAAAQGISRTDSEAQSR